LRFSLSDNNCFFSSGVLPESVTTYAAKYKISSSARGLISKISPIRLVIPLKYQIWDTGAASSICAILSRRTFAFVTSTPHRSHTTPLYVFDTKVSLLLRHIDHIRHLCIEHVYTFHNGTPSLFAAQICVHKTNRLFPALTFGS